LGGRQYGEKGSPPARAGSQKDRAGNEKIDDFFQ
jgi:hypothetical protein